MPAARPVLLLGAILGSFLLVQKQGGIEIDVGALAPAADHGRRIRYPPGDYPTVRLPDGSRRAIHSLLNVARPMRFGDFVWNEDGIPPGPMWVRIDLTRQTLSLFRGGHEIGTSLILYGTDGKPTPTGIFPIRARAKRHRSTLYDADMPFMLRLTGDGIAVHESTVRSGYATHGCIGVPPGFSKLLFDHVKTRDIVTIQRT